MVVSGNGPALLGRNWLHAIKLNWRYTKHVCCGVEDLLKKHASLFNEGLGTLKGINARLIIKTDTIPKFLKPRSVPYALRDVIEKELERLEKLGVIEKVNHSEWATPIVPVPKPDGSTRICGDYKVTINPQMSVDQYPLPKVDDLLAELAGGKEFIKLDLTHAYQQVLLELESQKYLTINTHLWALPIQEDAIWYCLSPSSFPADNGKGIARNTQGCLLFGRCASDRL